MPLPETIEKTYLPGDNIDAIAMNAVQHGITANHARIAQLAAPKLQWLIGKTAGDVSFDADGVATIDGTARVFLDCRLGPLHEIRVRCRVDEHGIELTAMDGAAVLKSVSHTGDGATWAWVAIALPPTIIMTETTRLSLAIVTAQPQQIDLVAS